MPKRILSLGKHLHGVKKKEQRADRFYLHTHAHTCRHFFQTGRSIRFRRFIHDSIGEKLKHMHIYRINDFHLTNDFPLFNICKNASQMLKLLTFKLLYAVSGENWLCGGEVTSWKPAPPHPHPQVGCVIKRLSGKWKSLAHTCMRRCNFWSSPWMYAWLSQRKVGPGDSLCPAGTRSEVIEDEWEALSQVLKKSQPNKPSPTSMWPPFTSGVHRFIQDKCICMYLGPISYLGNH